MSTSPQFAFVTLVTSDSYLPGALVVAAALHDVHSSPPTSPDEFDPSDFHRVCLVTPETVNVSTVKQLRRAFDVVIGVEVIEEDTYEGLKLLGRLDLSTVLTKLHIFRLTMYRKIIFLDADVLTLRPISHLFRIQASFAAVPDVGWPDVFNSGFLVLEPSEEKFTSIMQLVESKGSWDGGDQGVLNEWVGPNWERLSFTYNTTPTAVYTYAPAYKRFGSQINNIHFIGPNKPWTQIPFRGTHTSLSVSAPSTSVQSGSELSPTSVKSGSEPSASIKSGSAPSYDYPALLDRWFDVYDSHYRPLTEVSHAQVDTNLPGPTADPLSQRYESAWDSGVHPSLGADVSGGKPPPLSLDELRRLAIEGTGKAEVEGSKEGVYMSLPLEGRIDLMRPPKQVPPPDEGKVKSPPVTVRIVVPDSPHTPVRQFEMMTTLPTPGPNEIPPAPSFRGKPLPPETPTYARLLPEAAYDSPDHGSLHAFHQTPSPVSPTRSPSSHMSPPLLLWNPAVEAPPSNPPPASNFPKDTYFPNQWDRPAKSSESEDDGGFFRLNPPPPIPEMLIKEGHYKAVIGESPIRQEQAYEQHYHDGCHRDRQDQEHHVSEQQPQSAKHHEKHKASEQPHYHDGRHPHSSRQRPQSPYPQPDRSKVGAVFPWEQMPRPAPERFFPRTDSPPPNQSFIQPRQVPELKIDVRPRATRVFPSESPVPAPSFPRTTKYDNAWDVVPSIQRYAARLVRPPPSAVSPVSAELGGSGSGRSKRNSSSATVSAEEYRRLQELSEVSSRDADDEDEGEEEEDEPSPFTVEEEGKDLSVSSSSRSSSTRKTYKMRGIQTPHKVFKHQSVQVPYDDDDLASLLLVPSRTHHAHSRKEQQTSVMKESKSGKSGRDRSSSTSLAKQKIQPQQPPAPAGGPSSPPVLSPSHQSPTLSSLTTASQVTTSTTATTTNDASSSTTQSLLLGPASPDDTLISLSPSAATAVAFDNKPPRRAQRMFDPARGVDVFKKGSEEVLARFLKMESWEEAEGNNANA